MTITQTIEVPPDYRIFLELPRSVPRGARANITIDINADASLEPKERISKQFAGALRLSDAAYGAMQNTLEEGRSQWNRNIS